MGADASVPYGSKNSELFRSFDAKRFQKYPYTERDEGRVPTVVLGNSPALNDNTIKRKELIDGNHTTSKAQQQLMDPNNSRPLKTTKSIFVQSGDGKNIRLSFLISEEQNLTCGWLISETIRQFAKVGVTVAQPNSPIAALQTVDGIITLDYWLSDLERSVSVLQDGMMLKPFYANLKYKVNNQRLNLKYFHILKLIGTGGFSKVYLARRKDTGRFYAIKVMSKSLIIEKEKEETIITERNIMTRIEHPFLVKLHYAFQSAENLYLVMDFYPGGELFYHLQKKKRINEEEAQAYMGEIILALNYLHKNNIIYRDLKPENILIDIDGHLHLADFGLCKIVQDKKQLNYTFCGSPEYLAPEVIDSKGYNFTVDFYCLGILIYEMVVGKPPFLGDTKTDLYNNILKHEIHYPYFISPKLKSFLTKILAKNPMERLGAKNGLPDIVNHPWCRNIDFVKIISKKSKGPIVPDYYKSNFSDEFIDAKLNLEEEGSAQTLTTMGSFTRLPYTMTESISTTKYKRFAAFSFYCNLEEPPERYVDSLIGTEKNSPRDVSPDDKPPQIVADQLLVKLSDFKKHYSYSSSKYLKSLREDYTEELNENSVDPNLKSLYLADQVKFFAKSGRNYKAEFSKSAVFQKKNNRSYTPTPQTRTRPQLQLNNQKAFGPLLNSAGGVKPVTEADESPTKMKSLSKDFSYSFAQNIKKNRAEKVPSKDEIDDQSPVNLETPKHFNNFSEEVNPGGNKSLHFPKKSSGYFASKDATATSHLQHPSPLVRKYTATSTLASQQKFDQFKKRESKSVPKKK